MHCHRAHVTLPVLASCVVCMQEPINACIMSTVCMFLSIQCLLSLVQELMLKLVEDMYPLPGEAEPQELPEKKPKRGRGSKRAAAAETAPDATPSPPKKPAKGRGKGAKASKAAAAKPAASDSPEDTGNEACGEREVAPRAPSARIKRRRTSARAEKEADAEVIPEDTAPSKGEDVAPLNQEGAAPLKQEVRGVTGGPTATESAAERPPLVVKLKMPASAGKPAGGKAPATGSRRSSRSAPHETPATAVAPTSNGDAPCGDQPLPQLAQGGDGKEVKMESDVQNVGDAPNCSGDSSEGDGDCWQPKKKSRHTSTGGPKRRATADKGAANSMAGRKASDHTQAPDQDDTHIKELKNRLQTSGAELNSIPASHVRPMTVSLPDSKGPKAGAKPHAASQATTAEMKVEPDAVLDDATSPTPASGIKHDPERPDGKNMAPKPEPEGTSAENPSQSGMAGHLHHQGGAAGLRPASRIDAVKCEFPGMQLQDGKPPVGISTPAEAAGNHMAPVPKPESAVPDEACRTELDAKLDAPCSPMQQALSPEENNAHGGLAKLEDRNDAAAVEPSGAPLHAMTESLPEKQASAGLAQSLQASLAERSAIPVEAEASAPPDVVELGDSDADMGMDQDADLVFLGESSTTMAAARNQKRHMKHTRHNYNQVPETAVDGPSDASKASPDDDLVLVDSSPGLTPLQQKRRDALTRRKMVCSSAANANHFMLTICSHWPMLHTTQRTSAHHLFTICQSSRCVPSAPRLPMRTGLRMCVISHSPTNHPAYYTTQIDSFCGFRSSCLSG